MKQKTICVLLMILGCSGVLCAAQKGQEFYQQALVEERAVGNLEKAIELFQRAAKESRGDRELAAKALLAAARCYEKLGQAKATELYEEVAGTYPEQRELATEARERLATLRRASAPGETATDALAEDIRATLRVDLRRIETLVQQLAQANVRSSELDDLRAEFQSIQNELRELLKAQ